MKLNHLNLPVDNVAESAAFFVQYFGFKCLKIKGDNLIAVLQGADGFILVLMANTLSKNGNTTYPEAFHFGFLVDSKDKVDSVFNRLQDGGINLGSSPAICAAATAFTLMPRAIF